MSQKRLPRACGTVIKCDSDGCDAISQTGQVYASLHVHYLRKLGWLVRYGAHERHLCPAHGAVKLAEIGETKRRVAAEKSRLAAVRAERKRRDALTPEQRKAEDNERRKAKRNAARAQQAAA